MPESDATAYSIAVIDDDSSTRLLLEWTLKRTWGYAVSVHPTAAACFSEIREPQDIVLIAVGAEAQDIAAVTASLHRTWPEVIVIVLTAHGEHEAAAAALHEGAWDYFDKPMDLHRMKHVLEQALRHRALEQALKKRERRKNAAKQKLPTMDQVTAQAVVSALRQSGNNVKEAARLLDVGRTTMYKLMARYHIDHHELSADGEM